MAKSYSLRFCWTCGDEFTPTGGCHHYCGKACRMAARLRGKRAPNPGVPPEVVQYLMELWAAEGPEGLLRYCEELRR